MDEFAGGNSEMSLSCELAATCRLAYQFDWNRSVLNHVTGRSPLRPNIFLMNPVGILWSEIAASDFVTCDIDGSFTSTGRNSPGPAGLTFHSAIYRANPEVNYSFHLHPRDCVTLASIQCDISFITQDSLRLFDQIAYHDFEGLPDEPEEGERIAAMVKGKLCVVMRNHGILTVGRTVGEAFYAMQIAIETCAIQLKALATGLPLREISRETCRLSADKFKARSGGQPIGRNAWEAHYRMLERSDPAFKK
ncbi:MAG: class II aldolase/adducin family protein [Legionella sp.]|nr:class II aldolase/adducin family protein [Legionella sp.]